MGKFAYEKRNRAIYTPRNPESFSHDLDGNLLNDGTWVYTWDAENRLVGMENTNDYYVATGKKQKLAFAYDETGRRVEKKVWSWDSGAWALVTHHRFLYDGWNMMAQLDGNNGNDVLKAFTWGNDISGSMDDAGGVGGLLDVQDYGIGGCSFYMYDGNGNVAGLTGCYGGFDAEYAYDPYGGTLYDNPIYDGVTKDNPFRFSTKYLDFETGLYYYGYRYYNPDQGRWISRDPIEEEGGLNLYAFVGNEPVGKWDLLGTLFDECSTVGSRSEYKIYLVELGYALATSQKPVNLELLDETLNAISNFGLAASGISVAGGAIIGGLKGAGQAASEEAWQYTMGEGVSGGASASLPSYVLSKLNHNLAYNCGGRLFIHVRYKTCTEKRIWWLLGLVTTKKWVLTDAPVYTKDYPVKAGGAVMYYLPLKEWRNKHYSSAWTEAIRAASK